MTPVLLVLIFGIVEFSLYLRDAVSVSSAVRTGVRIASAEPGAGPGICPGPSPDLPSPPPCTPANAPAFAQAAADAIQKAGTAMPKDSINYIFVYRSNAKGYPGSASNTTMPTTPAGCTAIGNCVTYVWQKSKDKFRYDQGSWASTSINACILTKNADGSVTYADSIGVYMKVTHKFVSGLFGRFAGLADKAVMTFEPLSATQCKPNTHP